jgi:Rps23 Pro-64 3,4-dihydroxylase Tpa1-like proline 4-hydroxylase
MGGRVEMRDNAPMSDVDEAAPPRRARSYMPPFRVLPGFLAPAETAQLLDYAAANEAAFRATKVGVAGKGRVDPSFRISRACSEVGETGPLLARKLKQIGPDLTAALKVTPFEVSRVELQLVAHGDGAYYRRHIDTQTAVDVENVRVLSGVFYLNRQPRGFAGGALRLYAIGGDEIRFVDVEPAHNSLVVFPAWAPHEVMPVSCPSGAFMDSRFAVNCWLHKRRIDG